jgi:ubiquinone biosynthesis protein COQ9
MTTADPNSILDAALALAEQRGWDAVHLHEVAHALGVPLADVARHYRDKDALVEGWFDRADAALLALAQSEGWIDLAPRQRLQQAICGWLEALAPRRRITGHMLRYKFQPEHLHLHAQGAVRISRTVQWIREVARLPAVGWRREFEEAVLTSIYLATFACWLADDSADFQRTRALLDRLLSAAERTARWLDRAR